MWPITGWFRVRNVYVCFYTKASWTHLKQLDNHGFHIAVNVWHPCKWFPGTRIYRIRLTVGVVSTKTSLCGSYAANGVDKNDVKLRQCSPSIAMYSVLKHFVFWFYCLNCAAIPCKFVLWWCTISIAINSLNYFTYNRHLGHWCYFIWLTLVLRTRPLQIK